MAVARCEVLDGLKCGAPSEVVCLITYIFSYMLGQLGH